MVTMMTTTRMMVTVVASAFRRIYFTMASFSCFVPRVMLIDDCGRDLKSSGFYHSTSPPSQLLSFLPSSNRIGCLSLLLSQEFTRTFLLCVFPISLWLETNRIREMVQRNFESIRKLLTSGTGHSFPDRSRKGGDANEFIDRNRIVRNGVVKRLPSAEDWFFSAEVLFGKMVGAIGDVSGKLLLLNVSPLPFCKSIGL